MIGHTLSHYRVTAALGAGGLGEVYRATDTSLDRDVAIKVLPPEVAQDRERLARFQREAHPPRKLFDAPPMRPGWDDYAVTSDGKRFLVKIPIGEEPEPRFHVVMNWPSLLE